MENLQAFWSYVHDDDVAERGRLTVLAEDVGKQFEMLTAEKLSLFVDKDQIAWGENWKDKIDFGLASVAYFIAIITPRYFLSPECRRELQTFSERATALGLKELVLPIIYVDVPEIRSGAPADNLVAMVQTYQWEDWREIRFSDLDSGQYRKAVFDLASKLADANRRVERFRGPIPSEPTTANLDPDDLPGILDVVAKTEEAFPLFAKTLSGLTTDIGQIGQIFSEATEEMNRDPALASSFAARLSFARTVSERLREPIERVWANGQDYVRLLNDIDEGLRFVIEVSPAEVNSGTASVTDVREFFATIHQLSDTGREAMTGVRSLREAVFPLDHISRDLRAVLRRLGQGLTIILETADVFEGWERKMSDTGIDGS